MNELFVVVGFALIANVIAMVIIDWFGTQRMILVFMSDGQELTRSYRSGFVPQPGTIIDLEIGGPSMKVREIRWIEETDTWILMLESDLPFGCCPTPADLQKGGWKVAK